MSGLGEVKYDQAPIIITERGGRMTEIEFIPEAVAGAPIEFPWKGASYHYGPADLSGPLLDHVADKTTCGTICLCAGITLWAVRRLHGHTDTSCGENLTEAMFAYQIDWRYVDREAIPAGPVPEEPPPLSAIMAVQSFARRSINHKRYWNHYYQPIEEAFHAAHIVGHIMPDAYKKSFPKWLKAISARLDAVAAKPDEPKRNKSEFESLDEYNDWVATHRGVALPPEILDPDFDYQEDRREEFVAQFLQELDQKTNRYLRTPEAMLELGFEGTPYELGR